MSFLAKLLVPILTLLIGCGVGVILPGTTLFDAYMKNCQPIEEREMRMTELKWSSRSEAAFHRPDDERPSDKDPLAIDIFKKTGGEGDSWRVWDRLRALSLPGVSCNYHRFVPRWSPEKNASMCLHPPETDTFISEMIANPNFARWGDCNILVTEWHHAVSAVLNTTSLSTKPLVYVEIGANIGACLMEMLLSTDAMIVAFEPEPRNVAQLTTTLMSMDPSYRERVALFPIALGSGPGKSEIYTATDNRGNAIIGDSAAEIRKDHANQTFFRPVPIWIEALDDILDAEKVTVPLIKMDAQGFECNILDGMGKLLNATYGIKTEVDEGLLKRHGCSANGMLVRMYIGGGGFQLAKFGPMEFMARKYPNPNKAAQAPSRPIQEGGLLPRSQKD